MLRCIWLLQLIHQFSLALAMQTNTKGVVVTGATRGIGKSICQRLLREDPDPAVRVFLCGRQLDRAREAVESIMAAMPEAAKGRLEPLLLDVTSEDSVANAARQIEAAYGKGSVYALINNAGIALDVPWQPDWQKRADTNARETVETNVYGAMRCFRHFRPLMCRGGRVVNVSSGAGMMNVQRMRDNRRREMLDERMGEEAFVALVEDFIRCWEGTAAEGRIEMHPERGWWLQTYGFSKAVLNLWTRIIARQHSELQINVCTPGFILTGMTEGYEKASTLKTPEEGAKTPVWLAVGDHTHTGRLFGGEGDEIEWVGYGAGAAR
mmetsp:Transcript_778/g.1676  ORF Transcript_778/g.1676 Transcript_778/m.1676 type:complete len:323 (+) Transcript_778:57-1025(+)